MRNNVLRRSHGAQQEQDTRDSGRRDPFGLETIGRESATPGGDEETRPVGEIPTRAGKRTSRVSRRTSPAAFPAAGTWVVYLLGCGDGTLYAGVTNDLEHRVEMHNSGRGAKYTRGRLPVQVLYFEICDDHGCALRRERAIKRLSRREKLGLVG